MTATNANFVPGFDRGFARCCSLLMVLHLSGFAMVTFFPTYLHVQGRLLTVPFRGLVLALCLYCCAKILLQGLPRHIMSLSGLTIVVFWLTYSLRAGYELSGQAHPWIGTEYTPLPWEFTLYLFCSTIPAFVAAYLINDLRIYGFALNWTLTLSLAGCLMSLQYHWDNVITYTTSARLQANDLLNPISYGHMGTTAALLSLFCVVRGGKQLRIPRRVILLGGVVLGVVTVFLSASRGPLIALVGLVPVVVFFAAGGTRNLSRVSGWFILLCLASICVLPTLVNQVVMRGVDLYTYFGSLDAFTASESSLNRIELMRSAWNMFVAHPLFGYGLFEPITIAYPHNTILEAFMATGILGGAAYAVLIVVATTKAFRLMNHMPELAWLPIVFLQLLVNSMVSSSLYFDPTFFALMGAMLGATIMNTQTSAVAATYSTPPIRKQWRVPHGAAEPEAT